MSTWLASPRAINTYRVTSVLAPTYHTYYASRLATVSVHVGYTCSTIQAHMHGLALLLSNHTYIFCSSVPCLRLVFLICTLEVATLF